MWFCFYIESYNKPLGDLIIFYFYNLFYSFEWIFPESGKVSGCRIYYGFFWRAATIYWFAAFVIFVFVTLAYVSPSFFGRSLVSPTVFCWQGPKTARFYSLVLLKSIDISLIRCSVFVLHAPLSDFYIFLGILLELHIIVVSKTLLSRDPILFPHRKP